MQQTQKLQPGKFYHIYNHAVGGRNLFHTSEHYEYFLHQYNRYMEQVAETYAWALMPNHFHFLVKIKEDVVYKYSNEDKLIDKEQFNEIKWQTCKRVGDTSDMNVKIPQAENHISHLCNSYARYFNTRKQEFGTLFNSPFKRKQIDVSAYLKNTLLYIHNNPVHHGFCDHPMEYPWTSYLTCISTKPTQLKRDGVMGWFDDNGEFINKHGEKHEWKEFEKWLGI